MLDETPEVELQEVEAEVVTEEAPPVEEPEEVEIGFADDEPEVEPETPLIKKLRIELRDRAKREKELLAKIAASEPEQKAPPQKPTIESCGFDEAKFESELSAWFEGKAARDEAERKARQAQEAKEADWKNRLSAYDERKAALKVPDFADAEETVRNSLTTQQQAVIVRNIADPAAFVYALGRSGQRLSDLAAVQDIDMFTAAIVRMEGKLTTEPKKKPESRLPGTSAPTGGGAGKLDALYAAAQKSGDYSAYYDERRRLKEAGQKV